MVRSRRLLPLFGVLVVFGWLAEPASVAGQDPTPTSRPGVCDAAPRTIEAFRALGGTAAASATGAGTPTDMPEGPRPDAETAAIVAGTIADFGACVAAGDYLHMLGFFSDGFVQRYIALVGWTPEQLNDLAARAMMTQYAAQVTATRHMRATGDGRVALIAVTQSSGLVYLELVRTGDRWLIDVVAILPQGREGEEGIFGRTYTDPYEHFGLEWDASWQRLSPEAAPMTGDLVLDNGVSYVVFRWLLLGIESLQTVTTLAQCVGEPSPYAFAVGTVDPQSIAVALDSGDRPMRGVTATSGFGVYDLHYYPAATFDPSTGQASGRYVPYRLYVECRTLPGEDQFLQVNHLVATAEYDAQVPARQTLLDAIEI